MQKLVIAGNVGKDAELRRRDGQDPVLNFSLAVDNGKDAQGQPRPATWYDCSIWGKRGESLERHITKGKKLTLFGRPGARSHEGKAYLTITVDDLTFQGGGDGNQQRNDRGGYDDYGSQSSGYGGGGRPGGRSSEIPFLMEWS